MSGVRHGGTRVVIMPRPAAVCTRLPPQHSLQNVKILQSDCRSVPGVAEPSAVERAVLRRVLLVLRAGRAFVVVDAVLEVPLGGADEGADALVHLTRRK